MDIEGRIENLEDEIYDLKCTIKELLDIVRELQIEIKE